MDEGTVMTSEWTYTTWKTDDVEDKDGDDESDENDDIFERGNPNFVDV